MRENNNDSNNNDSNDADDDGGLKDVEEMRLLPISNSMNNDIILALHTINNQSLSSSLSSVDVLNHRILDGLTRTTTTNTTATSTSRSIQEMIDLFLHGYPTNPTP